jgi:hypothetical protein
VCRNVKQLSNKSGQQTRGAEEMKLVSRRATSLDGGKIVKTATRCYEYLGLKLFLIAGVSLFIRTRDGADVQVAGCVFVCARPVLVERWSSKAGCSMFVLHVQRQVSDSAVLIEVDEIWQLQIDVRCV